MDGLMSYWPLITFAATVIVLPGLGWVVRKGLASQADLSAAIEREQTARSAAQRALEERLSGGLAAIERSQVDLANRTLRIEAEIQHLPNAEDIGEMKIQLSRTEARLESLDRETQSITRALTRVENHLLKGATL